MKTKVKAKRSTGEITLVVESDKGDELDYNDAKCVSLGSDAFLPVEYVMKGKAYQFTYHADRHVSVDALLGEPMGSCQIQGLLLSFLRVMEECEHNALSLQRVMFDQDKMFYDPQRNVVRFAYVPTKSFVAVKVSIRDALVGVCKNIRPVDPLDRELVDRVVDYVYRTTLFSSVDYRRFLRTVGVLPLSAEEQAESQFRLQTDPERTTHSFSDGTSGFGFDFVQEQTRRCEEAHDGDGVASRDGHSPSGPYLLASASRDMGWQLVPGEYTIGRASDCSISISDNASMSRHHATLTVLPSGCTICDEGSTNGVVVNGARIPGGMETRLVRGDSIALGSEKFELR